MMPLDLILIRHAESEGNVANRKSRAGDDSAFTPEFMKRHSSAWRLSDNGIWQTQQTKLWLYGNTDIHFDRKYVTQYLRGIETAYHLTLPGPPWYVDFYLRERDYGLMDVMPESVRREKFAEELARREIDNFFWRPPRGESMAELCLRIDRVLSTLHRECSRMRVVIVNHGDVMWAFRVRLERMSQQRYHQLDISNDPLDRINNCQILHYTRINPETGEEASHLDWMRSICPWDPTRSKNEWERIVRPKYTDADLKAIFEEVPRLVS